VAAVLYASQGMVNNSIMDSIRYTMDACFVSHDTFNTVLENYLRGMVEYWGTTRRDYVLVTAKDIPDEMLIPVNGTMSITTTGWKYSGLADILVLALISVIPGLTMCAVAMDYLESRRKVHGSPERPACVAHQPFNASDPLHVILASGSGGLCRALRARSGGDLIDYKSLRVHLGVQDDGMAVLTAEDSGEVDVAESGEVDEEAGEDEEGNFGGDLFVDENWKKNAVAPRCYTW